VTFSLLLNTKKELDAHFSGTLFVKSAFFSAYIKIFNNPDPGS